MCGRQQCALPRINGIMHQKIHNTEEIMHFNDIINAVLNGLAEFRFQDFIDIVIITVIIYKIICWTVNTRAYQLLKGLAVLLVVMLLSALFNLYTVNYLLNTLLVSGIVVMVVLFQPELRRALAHIGRFKFNLPGREVENSNVIVKENESLDSALRRFKRNCAKAGIQQEIRRGAQDLRNAGDRCGVRGGLAAFPLADGLLGDPQLGRQFRLAHALLLAALLQKL